MVHGISPLDSTDLESNFLHNYNQILNTKNLELITPSYKNFMV